MCKPRFLLNGHTFDLLTDITSEPQGLVVKNGHASDLLTDSTSEPQGLVVKNGHASDLLTDSTSEPQGLVTIGIHLWARAIACHQFLILTVIKSLWFFPQ